MTADTALGFIVDQLRAEDPIVRAEAARLLGELKRPDSVPSLITYLQKERYYTKVAGIYALWQIADPACVPVLQEMVQNPNVPDDWYWYARRAVIVSAAIGLSVFDDDTGLPFLQELLENNHDVILCWYAPTILRLAQGNDQINPVAGLKKIARQITVDTIFDTTGGRRRLIEPGLLSMIAEALGVIGSKEAQSKLAELFTHSSRYVRARACLSLLEADASDTNRQRVSDLLLTDQTDFVAIKASLALAKAFDDEREKRTSVIAKIASHATDPFDRAVAIESLGMIPDVNHADVITNALDDADAYVRQCAAEACPRQPELRKRFETLRQHDPSLRVRLSSCKWLAILDAHQELTR